MRDCRQRGSDAIGFSAHRRILANGCHRVTATATFAEMFAVTMARRGLTDQEAGKLLGVSQPTITRWRTGRFLPDQSMVPALARFCGASQRDLFKLLETPIEQRRGPGEGSLGSLLQCWERDRGIDAAEAWRRLGVDKSTFYRWRADKGVPRMTDIPSLAAKLGLPEERVVMAVYRTELRKAAR